MFNSAAPPTTCIITSTQFSHRGEQDLLRTHSLTHPDVQSQCVTAVLSERGEDFVSESPALRHAVCTQTSFEGLNFIYSFSNYYNPLFTYPRGWSSGRFSRRTSFAWQRSKAAVRRGGKKNLGARGKGIGNRHIQQVKQQHAASFSAGLLFLLPPAPLRKFCPHMFT